MKLTTINNLKFKCIRDTAKYGPGIQGEFIEGDYISGMIVLKNSGVALPASDFKVHGHPLNPLIAIYQRSMDKDLLEFKHSEDMSIIRNAISVTLKDMTHVEMLKNRTDVARALTDKLSMFIEGRFDIDVIVSDYGCKVTFNTLDVYMRPALKVV